MFILKSYSLAVVFCIVTMLCWGSWANTQKLAKKQWPFQLYYWDYSLGVMIITTSLAFTLGSIGTNGRSFLIDLAQADLHYIIQAFIGGVIFNFANLLLVIAIEIAGMAIAFPIGIGLALVLGVITNYDPLQTNHALVMWGGVVLITLAILLDAFAYRQLPKKGNNSTVKGILFSILAGISMGFFYRYVASSMVSDLIHPEGGKLTPYTALVIFSLGLMISNVVFNTINMYKPVSGMPVTFIQYFRDGNLRLHLIGILGGIIWGLGMSLNILASGVAGPALAYGLGQGATLVAAIWGVFIWKEFKGLPADKNWIVFIMFCCFISGIILLVYSK
ncbi:MAG: GRP family sugar transporter [Chitinophagaceae bacterium]